MEMTVLFQSFLYISRTLGVAMGARLSIAMHAQIRRNLIPQSTSQLPYLI